MTQKKGSLINETVNDNNPRGASRGKPGYAVLGSHGAPLMVTQGPSANPVYASEGALFPETIP